METTTVRRFETATITPPDVHQIHFVTFDGSLCVISGHLITLFTRSDAQSQHTHHACFTNFQTIFDCTLGRTIQHGYPGTLSFALKRSCLLTSVTSHSSDSDSVCGKGELSTASIGSTNSLSPAPPRSLPNPAGLLFGLLFALYGAYRSLLFRLAGGLFARVSNPSAPVDKFTSPKLRGAPPSSAAGTCGTCGVGGTNRCLTK